MARRVGRYTSAIACTVSVADSGSKSVWSSDRRAEILREDDDFGIPTIAWSVRFTRGTGAAYAPPAPRARVRSRMTFGHEDQMNIQTARERRLLLIMAIAPWLFVIVLSLKHFVWTQQRNMDAVAVHIRSIEGSWAEFRRTHDGFDDVTLTPYTGGNGMLAAFGSVPTTNHLETLVEFLEGTHPPRPIFTDMIRFPERLRDWGWDSDTNARPARTSAPTVRRTRITATAYALAAPRVPVRFAAGEA